MASDRQQDASADTQTPQHPSMASDPERTRFEALYNGFSGQPIQAAAAAAAAASELVCLVAKPIQFMTTSHLCALARHFAWS